MGTAVESGKVVTKVICNLPLSPYKTLSDFAKRKIKSFDERSVSTTRTRKRQTKQYPYSAFFVHIWLCMLIYNVYLLTCRPCETLSQNVKENIEYPKTKRDPRIYVKQHNPTPTKSREREKVLETLRKR